MAAISGPLISPLYSHCCQVLPRFPCQFERKNSANAKQIMHCHVSIFKRSGKEIFHNETKLTAQKLICVKLTLKN